jgi:enolase
MSKIKSIIAREILDSRGNPTIETDCTLSNGATGRAAVPSGASTGVHEALELRDGDSKRFNGLGVLKAVGNVNEEINKFVQGKDFDQQSLDEALIKLDGTENKSRLGANAILSASLSFARACATENKIELYEHLKNLGGNDSNTLDLPQPYFNVINGGKHADSGLDIQEFLIVPVGFYSFKRKVEAADEVISVLKKILIAKNYSIGVGDEGGFAPKLSSNEEAFDLLEQAIKAAGYDFNQIKLAIDAAASSFFKDGEYRFKIAGEEKSLSSVQLLEWYAKLINEHPIISIEDGFAEDDWQGFTAMTVKMGDKIQIVGDDLTVTNIKRIQTAIEKQAINSVLIKLNQIGTLTETIQAIQSTKKQGWKAFVSHRSGETNDTFIADLAVGLSCECIKSGSLAREERVCKYNRLMEIEEQLKAR